MKINRALARLLMLSLATGIYTPIKATTNNLSSQKAAQSSAYTQSSYRHGSIHTPDPTEVDEAVLKQGLLTMHQEAIATPYENTYILIAHWLRKSNLILQQSEINIIIHYTAEERDVYFFLGAAGAGKSTAIFALQGNKVTRDQEEESDDDNWNADIEKKHVKKSGLVFKKKGLFFEKTVQVKTPTIGDSAQGETVGAIVYYPEDRSQNIAFCDTEGFSGERLDVSEAAKCISAFAPFFALKTNSRIGGIVVVVSSHDILSGKGNTFKSSAHFLRAYLSAAGHTTLKTSVLLMITKYKGHQAEVITELRNIIQMSYQGYFKALAQVAYNSNNNNKVQDTHRGDQSHSKASAQVANNNEKAQGTHSIAALQPFFSMLLENEVDEGKENNIQNFRLDEKRMLFFDPCIPKSIQKTFKKLDTLQSLDHRYLCPFDNPLSQYLRAQILVIGDEVKKKATPILALQQRIKIQGLQLKGTQSKEALHALIAQLQNEIRQLRHKKQQQQEDDSRTCVFEDNHIEKLTLKRKAFYTPKVAKDIVQVRILTGAAALAAGAGAAAGGRATALSGTLAGAGGAVSAGALVGVLVGGAALAGSLALAGAASIIADSRMLLIGYCVKNFSYTGGAAIYQIEVTYENSALCHITPKLSVVEKHFYIHKTGDTNVRYVATAKSTRIKQNKWEFKHVTDYFQDANCRIKMYAKKNELASTHKMIADNLQKIKNKEKSMLRSAR